MTSQTVKSYLAAVRYTQIALGLGDPRVESMPRLEYVIRGVKKSATKKAVARLLITPQILKSVWERMPCQQVALMLWAASCLCFFGFLRAGEIVIQSDAEYDESSHLSYGDVRVNDTSNPQYLEIHLKASKTDPFRQGVSVVVGKTDNDVCPGGSGLGLYDNERVSPWPVLPLQRRQRSYPGQIR